MHLRTIAAALSLPLLLACVNLGADPRPGLSKALPIRKQLQTIVLSGLAGGALGLSTLSFYGRPQKQLSNIFTGFAVGIIIGVGYSTFTMVHSPQDFYSKFDPEAEVWQRTEVSLRTTEPTPYLARFTFVF